MFIINGSRPSVGEPTFDNQDIKGSEERGNLVTLGTDDTIWDWDFRTNFVERSAAAAKFGHLDWQSDPSMTWWERNLHPDDRDATIAAFADAIMSGKKSIAAQYRFCKADGEIAYIFDRAFIFRDEDNVAVRAIGVMIDLTELRLVKLLLRKTENRLAYSSRLNAMGTMGSMIAHELSQPLTAAANYIRAARRMFTSAKSLDLSKVEEALEKAEDNTLRAGEIIRRLRELVTSRAVNASDHLLEQLIDDSCTIGLGEARPAAVRLTTSVTPNDLAVWADRTQVQQVIINLVRNSVEAMETVSNPQLVITAIKIGKFAEITVQDNGIGIGHCTRDAIFSAIITTKEAGMGIGLSISRTIIEAHGGEIWLESSVPGRTVFRFTLPLIASTTPKT